MKVKTLLAAAAMAAGVAFAGASAHAAEYLANGSFETGDLTGWTHTGNGGFTSIDNAFSDYGSEDGFWHLYYGPVGSDGVISQTFNDNPGETLTISGWVAGNGSGYSDALFYFNGNLLGGYAGNVPSQPYTQLTFHATATGSDTFAFAFRNDPDFDAADNFSVSNGAVPEPATWALMLTGFFGAGAMLRRRQALVAA